MARPRCRPVRPPALADPRIRRLAGLVELREDAALTAMLPDLRPARVAIRLADGRVLAGETLTNRGDARDPYGPEEVRAKFLELACPVWGEPHATRVRAAIEEIDGATGPADLDRLLAEPPLAEERHDP